MYYVGVIWRGAFSPRLTRLGRGVGLYVLLIYTKKATQFNIKHGEVPEWLKGASC